MYNIMLCADDLTSEDCDKVTRYLFRLFKNKNKNVRFIKTDVSQVDESEVITCTHCNCKKLVDSRKTVTKIG